MPWIRVSTLGSVPEDYPLRSGSGSLESSLTITGYRMYIMRTVWAHADMAVPLCWWGHRKCVFLEFLRAQGVLAMYCV